jgi:DnaJ-class molecular chaperone
MDYYSVLGVTRNATQDEIKRAYKKLAMKTHPDRNSGDDTQFKKIQEAYETLGDPSKKQQYDNPQSHPEFNFNFGNPDIADIFAHMFGGGGRRAHSQKQTYRTTLSVSLMDAYNGSSHILQVSTPSGNKVINVTVPAGVESGDTIRYDSAIDNAILVIQFNVLPDIRFDRKGTNLHTTRTVSTLELIVGTKFKITTIDNKVLEVKVAPGTQPNTQLRIPNAGMPDKLGGYGDQIILLSSYTPDNINDELLSSIAKYIEETNK